MRIYRCQIEYERTGVTCYDEKTFDKGIHIKAKSVKEAFAKAKTYKEAGEVKKVTEVYSVEFVLEIDKE